MPERIPLGEKEGRRLEFKAAAALHHPEKLGREIVGMLNAEGGDLWIGLAESNGVAIEAEGVPDPDHAERALFDHLVETIEPPPRNEITIEQVQDEERRRIVLRVHVTPAKRNGPPYSYRQRDGRYFGVRVGDRLRTMSWHEIFADRDRSDQAEEKWRAAAKDVAQRLNQVLKSQRPVIWLCLRPVAAMNLDLKSHDDLFADPTKTKNRPNGWTFLDRRAGLARRGGRIVHGEPDARYTEVHRDGLILFSAPLNFLYWKGEQLLIWPYSLIEFPVSIFRLAARLYASSEPDDDRIAVQMALISAQGWKLKAGSVRSVRWQFEEASVLQERDIITELREQRCHQVVQNPDRCAYPLIQEVYRWFGFDDDDLPHEFDSVKGLEIAA